MTYDRGRLLSLIFIVISIGAVIYVSAASLNYLRLYPALGQLQDSITVDRVSFVRGTGSDQPGLAAEMSIRNPTDYSGFRIYKAYVAIFFFVQTNRNLTLFDMPNAPNATLSIGRALEPNSTISLTIPVALSSDQSNRLISFQNQHSGYVMAEVSFRVDINTFLVSVTGSSVFTGTQDTLFSLG